MKLRLVLMAIALATPALAGCIGAEDDPDDPLTGSKNNGSTGGPNGLYPDPIVRTPLTTALTASADWVKPGEPVTFTATPPAEAEGEVQYLWTVGKLPEGWGAQVAEDDPHAGHGEAAEEDPHAGHGDGASMLDTGEITAGASSDPMAFVDEGFYYFHCHPHPFMKAKVTVREGSNVTGTAHVAILDGEDGASYRFAPEEIEIAPGASIVWWNNGTMMHTATQEKYEPITTPIEGASGPEITFTPTEDGDYRVVVTVVDEGTGVGAAEVRLLVDSAKPDPTKTFEPKAGSFNVAAAGNSEASPNEFNYQIDYDASTFTVDFAATSPAGSAVEPQITVELFPKGGGSAVASEGPAASGQVVATDIPAGQYTVVVTPGQGVSVSYSVAVTAELLLVPPAPGAAGGHGGHAH